MLTTKDALKDNVSSLVSWTMTVSLATFAWEESVQLVARQPLIVQPPNLVLATSVLILVDKPHAVPMPNVQLWTKRLSALVWQDSCPTQQLSLAVPENLLLALPTTNVLKDSSAMPSFADLFVTVTMLACLTNFALTTFAKKSASLTVIVDPMRFAKVSNAFQDAGPTLIVL